MSSESPLRNALLIAAFILDEYVLEYLGDNAPLLIVCPKITSVFISMNARDTDTKERVWDEIAE